VTASAWAECFRHSHAAVDEQHHHDGTSDFLQHADSEIDQSASRIHCPQLRLDPASLASLSAKSDLKPRDHEYKLASLADLSIEQSVSSKPGRFPHYPFCRSASRASLCF
jgi:hypothetical protein